MRTPVLIGIKAMISNMVLNLLFVVPLHLLWQVGHAGLSLATTCSAYLNAGLLLIGLMRRDIYRPERGFMADIGRIALATILMAAVLLLAGGWLHGLAELPWQQRAVRLTGVCGVGIAVYFGALLLQHPRFLRYARGPGGR